MKFRTFIVPLIAAAGLVLILGLGFLGGLNLRNPLYLLEKGGQSLPMALQFVPKQSSVVASVLVRPDRLASLWEYLAAPKLRQSVQQDVQAIERSLLANTGLTYATDIQPWIGDEITVALVSPDLDQNADNGYRPGYLVVLTCRDSQAAQAQLELFWQNRAITGAALTFEDFSGSRLIYAQSSTPQIETKVESDLEQFATTLVADRFLLVANHPEVLRQALMAAQAADANLQTDPRYKTALQLLPSQRVGLLTINLPAVAHWLHHRPLPKALSQALNHLGDQDGTVDWGLMSVRLTRQGMMADMAWVAAGGQQLSPSSPPAQDWSSLARYLPDSLSLAVLGTDLATLGKELAPFLDTLFPDRGAMLVPTMVDQTFGPGAAAAILAGATQDYALGVDAPLGATTPDWFLLRPQGESMTTAVQRLTELVRQQGLGVGTVEIQGQPTTVWTRLSLNRQGRQSGQPLAITAEVAGLQTEVGDYGAIATSADALDTLLSRSQAAAQYPDWWLLTEQFRQPNHGYIHIDWSQVQNSLGQHLPRFRLWQAAAQPGLKHLQQVTLARYGRTQQVQTGSLFFQLSNS